MSTWLVSYRAAGLVSGEGRGDEEGGDPLAKVHYPLPADPLHWSIHTPECKFVNERFRRYQCGEGSVEKSINPSISIYPSSVTV